MKYIYRVFILLATLQCSFQFSWAQSPMYVFSPATITTGNSVPLAFIADGRNQMVMPGNIFSGAPSGLAISKLWFKVYNITGIASSQTNGTFKVMLGNAPGVNSLSIAAWASTANLTLGLDEINFSYPSIVASNWVTIPLTNFAPYDPTQPLLIDFVHTNRTTTGAGTNWYIDCNATAQAGFNNTYATTTNASAPTALQSYVYTIGIDLVPLPSSIPKIPPLANYKAKNDADTLWAGSPSVLVNTSSYSDTNYWQVTGYSSVGETGPWTTYSNPNDIIQTNNRGTWIDTVTNKMNFYYTFQTAGWYKVKLWTANRYGTSFVEKVVYVSNPLRKPRALFFSSKRTVAEYDRSQFSDLSLDGPTKWKWYLDPPCYDCGLNGKNEFFGPGGNINDTTANPFLQARDAGTFKVCLAVSNAVGADTLCMPSYIKVINGYQMCNGSDSVGFAAEGAVMPTFATGSTMLYYASGCSQGFRIAPCSDTIMVNLDRLRMRNNGGPLAPGDSLYIKTGILPGSAILRRWGGNDINAIKDSLRSVKSANSQLWVVYVPAAPQGPNVTVADSGFLVHWTSKPATYSKPQASFTCPDTIYANYKVVFANKSIGKNAAYAWDINNDRVYGKDNINLGIDSTNYSPSMIYNVTRDSFVTVCLKTYNCVSSDTFCKTILVRPTTVGPFADFTVNRTTGLTTDTFAFSDRSFNGANKWKWSFSPSNVTYLGGTDSTSQNPMLFLNTNTSYSVTMVASNQYGSSIAQKLNLITTISYPSPGSQFAPTSSVEDFGIVRVRLVGSVGRIDTITPLKPTDGSAYSPLFNLSKTTVFRGGTYQVDVYRGDNPQDPMNLRVWADFNRNANYLDPGELLMSSDKNNSIVKYTTQFTVPSDASIGTSRLLVGASAGFSTITPYSSTLGCYEEHGLIIGRDLAKPVITLKGDAITKTELNKPFVDSGATATDNIEGDISGRIEVISDVDISHIGYYKVKYVVKDYYDNISDTVIRVVQVEVNQTGPKIVMNGSDSVFLEVRKDSYQDAGASAQDNSGNDITPSMLATNDLDTSKVGVYHYTYSVYDAFGFLSTKKRTIIVRDTEKPTVHTRTFNDTAFVIHQMKTPFDENNYLRVDDNYWTNVVPVRVSGDINIDNQGIYYLTYVAIDGSGNRSNNYQLAVKVTNTFKPTITLVGASDVTLKVFSNYSDPKATAKDYFNQPVPVDIYSDSLRVDLLGTYQRVYRATDEYGQFNEVTRTFHVKDLDAPVITVLGDNPLQIPIGTMTNDEILQMIDQRSIKVQDNYDQNPLVSTNAAQLVGSFDKPGTYMVTYGATDFSGNRAQSKQRFLMIMPSTGVAQTVYNDASLKVFPNPGKGVFNISLSNQDIRNIKIYNIAGVLVKDVHAGVGVNMNQIDLTNEKEGMYLLRIETNDKTFTTKVNISK